MENIKLFNDVKVDATASVVTPEQLKQILSQIKEDENGGEHKT